MTELAVDLAERWRRARCAALRAVLSDEAAPHDEDELLRRALERDAEQVLRLAFDYSRRLGEGFRRFYKLDPPISDLVRLLPSLATPCLGRRFTRVPEEPAYLAEAEGCEAPAHHPRACDFFREAIDGLVLGMTGAVRFARHESLGHGSSRCVDAFYVYPHSALKFGPIPDELRPGLESAKRLVKAFDSTIDVEYLGLSEGVLHYRSRSGRDGGLRATAAIERALVRRFPWLSVREVTSRPVIVETSA